MVRKTNERKMKFLGERECSGGKRQKNIYSVDIFSIWNGEVDRVALKIDQLGKSHLSILARMSSFVTLLRRKFRWIFFFIFRTSIRSIVSLSSSVAWGNCSETRLTSRVLRFANFSRISCSSLSWCGGLHATKGSRIVSKTSSRRIRGNVFCILGLLRKKEVCIVRWSDVD